MKQQRLRSDSNSLRARAVFSSFSCCRFDRPYSDNTGGSEVYKGVESINLVTSEVKATEARTFRNMYIY